MRNNKSKTNKQSFKGKRNGGYSSGKPSRLNRNYVEDKDSVITTGRSGKVNSPSLYDSNPNLLAATAVTKFNSGYGLWNNEVPDLACESSINGYSHFIPLDAGTAYVSSKPTEVTGYSVPGLLTISTLLTPGTSADSTSPLNYAAKQLYTNLRSKQTSSFNFDAPDLMMYCLAVDNAVAFYNWMQRLYGLLNMYEVQNGYLPDSLIIANRVSAHDLRVHMADFRRLLHLFATKMATIPMPRMFKLFERHSVLMSNVYTDGDVNKPQYYMYVPVGFYKFNETETEAPVGKLSLVTINMRFDSHLLTFSDLESMVNQFLISFNESSALQDIAAAILRVVDNGNYFTLTGPADDYTVKPVYSAQMLDQIHNAHVITGFTGTGSDIIQTGNSIIFNPVITGAHYFDRIMLDWDGGTPTPTELAEMTRSASVVTDYTDSTHPNMTGSELFVGLNVWKMLNQVSPTRKQILARSDTFGSYYVLSPNVTAFRVNLDLFTDLDKFNKHPLIYQYVEQTDSDYPLFYGVSGDLSNYTFVTPEWLGDLDLVCLMSLFGIPYMQ